MRRAPLFPVNFKKDLDLPYRPWVYFQCFLFSSLLLDLFHLSLSMVLWALLAGIFLPMALAFFSLPRASRTKTPWSQEAFSGPPLWVWVTGTLAAVLLRLWGSGSPGRWPGEDESLIAYYALEFSRDFHWEPFTTLGQNSSTLSYLCFFTLKATGSPLLALHLPPTLVSIATLFMAHATARRVFSKSLSFTLSGLWAFNYWVLLIAYPLLPGILIPLWAFLCGYLLTRFLERPKTWAFPLGLGLAAGAYTYFSWLALLPLAAGVLLVRRKKGTGICILLGSGFLLGLAPFLWGVAQEGYLGHMTAVSAWTHHPTFLSQTQVVGQYLFNLFWAPPGGSPPLPSEGGFLNLVGTPLFLLGVLELLRSRRGPWPFFFASAFGLFLLPGLLSNDLQPHRALLTLPILVTVAAFGVHSLLLDLPREKRGACLGILLLFSAGLDLHRVFRPFDLLFHPGRANSFNEKRVAYEALERLTLQEGPGWVFTGWIPHKGDFSLDLCVFPFNAAQNGTLGNIQPQWAACFTEARYPDLLAQRFPGSKWLALPSGIEGSVSRRVLGLIPVTPKVRPILQAWLKEDAFRQRVDFRSMDLTTGLSRKDILRDLREHAPQVPDDPFLWSCYFDKLAYLYSAEKTFNPEEGASTWEGYSGVFHEAFHKSYQDTALCQKFGRLLAVEGRTAEARSLFRQALKSRPGDPWLEEQLRLLDPKVEVLPGKDPRP